MNSILEAARKQYIQKRRLLLVDGNIPAKTECPFVFICEIKKFGNCKHLGLNNETKFSCGAARSFQCIIMIITCLGKNVPLSSFDIKEIREAALSLRDATTEVKDKFYSYWSALDAKDDCNQHVEDWALHHLILLKRRQNERR